MSLTMDQLLDKSSGIGSLPDIVHRINRVIDDPRSSMDDVAATIAEDPSLSARLLRIANSALYATPFPVDTITRALTMIGSKQLRDLVAATYVVKMFSKTSGGRLDPEAFWRHSIACGVAARVIATACREMNVERYYLCGLLHDIGQLVIFTHLPDAALEILQRAERGTQSLYQVERKILGFDHAALGGRLLEKWQLPPGLASAVKNHHDPMAARDYNMEASILHLADIFSLVLFPTARLELFLPPLDDGAWQRVNRPASSVTQLLEHIRRQFGDARSLFMDGE
ncbi:MAG: HDOD domain-containing protein [Magnetococcales bacterium]|nr:HDOD domain-containing protein [Magnetococcales bacterium]